MTMKTWLAKWRISNALDEGKPLAPDLELAATKSAELREFVENAATVERALKNFRPVPSAPPTLHASIMRAVQSAETVRAFAWPAWRLRLAALGLLVGASFLGVNWFLKSTPAVPQLDEPSVLARAGSVLEMSDTFVRAVPMVALSPLNEERLRLERDLAGTQEFLLTSLP